MIVPCYFFLSLVYAVMLGGCSQPPSTSPGLTYVPMPKVPISVSGVSVSVSPSVRENHPLVTVPLSQMVKQWAEDRWQPMGGRCQMIFHISDINVKEEALACAFSPERWVSVANSDIYKGKMKVSCLLRTPTGQLMGKTDFTIRHEQHIPENYTLTQRKELWNQVLEGLINQLTIETNNHIPGMVRRTTGSSS